MLVNHTFYKDRAQKRSIFLFHATITIYIIYCKIVKRIFMPGLSPNQLNHNEITDQENNINTTEQNTQKIDEIHGK